MPALPGDRATRVLAEDIAAFERAGCRLLERRGPHEAVLDAPGLGRLVLRLARVGRVFGGNWGMELMSDEPLLPPMESGLVARGTGVVKQRGVRFRPRRRGDDHAARLAEALTTNRALSDALGRVHFERLWVRRDGRPVIRHLGGSVVWVAFPPIVRTTPLPPGQADEILHALAAFRAAAQEATKTDLSSV